MYARIQPASSYMCCGVAMLSMFRDWSSDPSYCKEITKKTLEEVPGAGLFQAGFRKGEPVDDKMFAHLASICDVEYVSPVRKNTNSGNMFYTAIFSLPERP